MRWGLSPVFIYECLANSRRWQTYAICAAGVAILLVAIASIAMTRGSVDPTRVWQEYAALGEAYFYAIIGVELTLVMLAAPAATAGAICVDRARGTLTHMLVTDLTDPEIVLGKLAARLLPILGLVACTWPVLAICSLLGGIDPTALTAGVRNHPGRRLARLRDGSRIVSLGQEAPRGRARYLHVLDSPSAVVAAVVRSL